MSQTFGLTTEIVDHLRGSETAASLPVQLTAALGQPDVQTSYTLSPTSLLQYPMEALRDGARGYWRLGESSGTVAADASTNGFHGTYVAPVTLGSPGALAAALASDVNTAVTFAAAGSLTIPHQGLLNFATGNFTVELWIDTTQSSGLPANIVDKTTGGVFPYRLRLVAGGFVEAARSDGTATATLTSSLRVDDDAWHYVAFSRSGTTLSLVIDQAAPVTTTDTTTSPSSAADITVAGGLVATLDELAIYGSALSDTLRTRHYSAAKGIEVAE